MNDCIRMLVYNMDADRRQAVSDAASADPDVWNTYLGTRGTRDQRADRAGGVRVASAERREA